MEVDQHKALAAQKINSNNNFAAAGGHNQNAYAGGVNSAGKPITCSDFQFKSYVAVRTIIY